VVQQVRSFADASDITTWNILCFGERASLPWEIFTIDQDQIVYGGIEYYLMKGSSFFKCTKVSWDL
jgi:hypothetical protein